MKYPVLFLWLAGTLSANSVHHCGKCLCTYYDNGCFKADCSHQGTSTLPDQVPNQTCILVMTENGIQSLRGHEFSRLTNLTSLDLSSNQIATISRHAFVGLSQLRTLLLSHNDLDFSTDKVHAEVFTPLYNLRYLDIKRNSYNEYPEQHLDKLFSLEYLSLDGLQDRSFGSGFSHLGKLTSLNLAGSSIVEKCQLNSLDILTFGNVTTIKSLNVSFCNICYIEPNTFSILQNIETLDLSHNENLLLSGVENATVGLQDSNLRQLLINQVVPYDAVCVVITKSLVENLQNTSLEVIQAKDNRIEIINVDALETLPKSLKRLSAGNNRFTIGPYLYNLDILNNMTSLDLGGSRVTYSLLSNYSDRSHTGVTQDTKLNKQSCARVTKSRNETPPRSHHPFVASSKKNPFKVPPQLKTFHYRYGQLFYDLADIYLSENNLEYIDLSFNVLTSWHGPIHGVEKVTFLDLSNNLADYVDYNLFENFHSLKVLNISWNRFEKPFYYDINGTLLRNQQNLEVLDLTGNGISKLPYRFLEGLSSIQQLNLSLNSITTLNLNYTSNTNLKFINCSDNDIAFISEDVRDTLDGLAEKNNLSIDLSWNPFECTCDPERMRFLDWLHTTKVSLTKHDRLMCIEYDTKWWKFKNLKIKYNKLKEECKVYMALSMGLLTLVILFTSTALCGIVYRYRWRLQYLYYVGKRKMKKQKDYETLYDFDAFVSYSDKDIDFVRTLMLPKLEYDNGLNLYIRDRDSVPGTTIAENIIDGIQRSKKSILLVSEATLTSKWCRYELQMANMESVSTRRDVMIIVIVESVPTHIIPPEILYQVQNNSTLQYPTGDEADKEIFWASLTEAIKS